MNVVQLHKQDAILKGEIHLTSSKSESNRALIIQAICETPFTIKNLSPSEDTETLKNILQKKKNSDLFNCGHAGTTFRFLTAYFASQNGTVTLTGSYRMKQRPIGILVDALLKLGAQIEYLEKEGFPPLKITGKELNGGTIEMDGSMSSQYISALALIAPRFKSELHIKFKGEVTSKPYINMTLKMMKRVGVDCFWSGDKLKIQNKKYQIDAGSQYSIEADWSSASYWYSMAALAKEVDLKIYGLKEKSLQGDAVITSIYSFFGVHTDFFDDGIRLSKVNYLSKEYNFDCADCPDIAQTIAVTACGLGEPIILSGLKTLRIKETDRIQALINELKKINCVAEEIREGVLKITPGKLPNDIPAFKTYYDHRMAMAFAPLAMLNKITIENPAVVKKSYPSFWNDLKKTGFHC